MLQTSPLHTLRILASLMAAFALPRALPAQDYDFSELEGFISAHLPDFENNVAVYLFEGDASIFTYEQAFDLDTRIPIASASKWIAAGVILAVAEAGYFDLDDPISRYVDAFDRPDKREITIRQGFSMTAGMVPENVLENGLARNPAYTHERSVELIAERVEVVHTPGEVIYYYGSGMQAAGLAAVHATGMADWQAVADHFLLGPMGMTDTAFTAFLPNPAVAGGVETTPADYLKFLKMVFQNGCYEGRMVLSSASVEAFFSAEGRNKPIAHSPFEPGTAFLPYDREPYYGFGTWILGDNPASGEIEELTSPGAFGTHPWIDRRRGLWGIVFTEVPAGSQTAVEPSLGVFDHVRREYDRLHPGRVPVQFIGEPASGWVDPEIRPGGNEIAFQTADGRVWCGRLDPSTGLLVEDSLEVVDTGATPMLVSWNGPEFAVDANGWSIVYNKRINGVPQLWQAVRGEEGWSVSPIFKDTFAARVTFLTSQSMNLPESWILYTRQVGGQSWLNAASLQDPDNEVALYPFEPRQPSHARPVAGYPGALVATGPETAQGQLLLYTLPEGTAQVVLSSDETIGLPVSVEAPERDGARLLGAVVGGDRMVFLEEIGPGNWTEVAAFGLPPEAESRGYTVFSSPEAFTIGGRFFVCLNIERPGTGVGAIEEAQIWFIAPELDGYPAVAVRTDEGKEGILQTDPEFYVTPDESEAYAIYNVATPELLYEIRRARSGLGSLQAPVPSMILHDLGDAWLLDWPDGWHADLHFSPDLADWSPVGTRGSPFLVSKDSLLNPDAAFWKLVPSLRY